MIWERLVNQSGSITPVSPSGATIITMQRRKRKRLNMMMRSRRKKKYGKLLLKGIFFV